MLKLDVFLSRLMPSVNGCPEPLARQAILDSAIEFCEETGIVRVTTDPVRLIGGNAAYETEVPSGQQVVTVQRAWYGTRELVAAPDSVIRNVGVYAPGTVVPDGQEPVYFAEQAQGEVVLYPTPGAGADRSLVFRVSTKPTRTATSVEDVLFNNWAEAIASGALARIHATPDTPYFSVGAAAHQMGLFRLGINRARSEAVRGRVRASLTVNPRSFG